MKKNFEFIGVMIKTLLMGVQRKPTEYFKDSDKGISNVLLGQIIFYSIIFSLFICYINHTFNH